MSRVCWMLTLAVFLAPVIVYADGADDDYWDDDSADDDYWDDDTDDDYWDDDIDDDYWDDDNDDDAVDDDTADADTGGDDDLTPLDGNDDDDGDDDDDEGWGGCSISNGQSGGALTVAMLMIGALAFVVGGRGARKKN